MDLWKIVNSLCYGKERLLDEVPDHELKNYPRFMINRAMSYYPDCLKYAQMMNQCPDIDPRLHFDFYTYSLSKKKRFSSWVKVERDEYIPFVKELFQYNEAKAKEALKVLSLAQLEEIKKLCQRE